MSGMDRIAFALMCFGLVAWTILGLCSLVYGLIP